MSLVVETDSAEEGLVRSTVRDIARGCTSRQKSDPDGDPRCWATLKGTGLTDLRSRDSAGARMGSTTDALIVLEEMGRSLCGGALVPRAALVPELIHLASIRDSAVLELAEEGKLGLVLGSDFASFGHGAGHDTAWDAFPASHALAVRDGRVYLVDLGEATTMADLTRAERTIDGTFTDIASIATDDFRKFACFALLSMAADALGASEEILELSTAYAKDRVQYGVAIGTFQAVQHLLADSHWRLDVLRSSLLYGAWALDGGDLPEACEAAAAAKSFANESTSIAVKNAMQVFGGISITWEHSAHLHLRRILVDQAVLGTGHHLVACPSSSRESADGLR